MSIDFAALADTAEEARVAAVEEYNRIAPALVRATVLTLAATVLAADDQIAAVHLFPSDQGDWMTLDGFVMADGTFYDWGTGPEGWPDAFEDTLDALAWDLPRNDGLTGEEWRTDDRYCTAAERPNRWRIDVRAAVAALTADPAEGDPS